MLCETLEGVVFLNSTEPSGKGHVLPWASAEAKTGKGDGRGAAIETFVSSPLDQHGFDPCVAGDGGRPCICLHPAGENL